MGLKFTIQRGGGGSERNSQKDTNGQMVRDALGGEESSSGALNARINIEILL